MGILRLTGGTLRNRRVHAGRGIAVRPTPGRVKEALFSILGERVVEARILDLYAGSGALGFEALSRGAASATFVEAHRPTAAALVATSRELGIADRCTVVTGAAERTATRLTGRFDLVFADPPYAHRYPIETFAAMRSSGAIGPASLVIYEHSSRLPAPSDPNFELVRSERYGAVALAFLKVAT